MNHVTIGNVQTVFGHTPISDIFFVTNLLNFLDMGRTRIDFLLKLSPLVF